jgi:hypothetical protein
LKIESGLDGVSPYREGFCRAGAKSPDSRIGIDLTGFDDTNKAVNSITKVGKMLVLAIVAIGIGLMIGRIRSHGIEVPSETNGLILPPIVVQTQPVTPAVGPGRDPVAPPQRLGWTNPATTVESVPWDARLDEILMRGGEANEKSDALLQVMATSPAESQVEIVPHLLNMTQDDHYDGVAGLLTNAETPSAVSTLLMNDLLNRHNGLKLPMLLAVASNGDHPLKDQAKDMLELFLQADYGTNWDQWGTAVTDWLQQNQ